MNTLEVLRKSFNSFEQGWDNKWRNDVLELTDSSDLLHFLSQISAEDEFYQAWFIAQLAEVFPVVEARLRELVSSDERDVRVAAFLGLLHTPSRPLALEALTNIFIESLSQSGSSNSSDLGEILTYLFEDACLRGSQEFIAIGQILAHSKEQTLHERFKQLFESLSWIESYPPGELRLLANLYHQQSMSSDGLWIQRLRRVPDQDCSREFIQSLRNVAIDDKCMFIIELNDLRTNLEPMLFEICEGQSRGELRVLMLFPLLRGQYEEFALGEIFDEYVRRVREVVGNPIISLESIESQMSRQSAIDGNDYIEKFYVLSKRKSDHKVKDRIEMFYKKNRARN